MGTGHIRMLPRQNRGADAEDFYQTLVDLPESTFDVALSYFQGTDRDPLLRPDTSGSGGITLVPYYQELRQIGLEVVRASGDTQLTFEGAFREASDERYFSGAAGIQHTFHDIGSDGGSLVAVGEYLYDNRSSDQPLTLFEDDLHLGFRYDASDIAGTSLTGGVYYDFESQSQIYTLSYSRRLSDTVRFDVSGFLMEADDPADPLSFVEQDSYIEMGLQYFF